MSSFPYPPNTESSGEPAAPDGASGEQSSSMWVHRRMSSNHPQKEPSPSLAPGMALLSEGAIVEGLFLERTRFVDCYDVVHLCIGYLNLHDTHNIRFVCQVWHDAADEHMDGQRGKIRDFVITHNKEVERNLNTKMCISQHKKLEWLAFNVSSISLGIVPWFYWTGAYSHPWNIPRLAAIILFFFSLVCAAPLYFWYFFHRMERTLKISGPFFSVLSFVVLIISCAGYCFIVLFPEVTYDQHSTTGNKYHIPFPLYWTWFAVSLTTLLSVSFITVPLELALILLFIKDGMKVHRQQIRNPLSTEYHENTTTSSGMFEAQQQRRTTVNGPLLTAVAIIPAGVSTGDVEQEGDDRVEVSEEDQQRDREEVAAIAKNQDNRLPCCVNILARHFLKARRCVTIKEVLSMMMENEHEV